MFDHISIGVENLEGAAAFYDAALAALGEAPFAIIQHGADAKSPGPGFHIAFRAPTREAVDRFHAAALSTGGVDEGPPGIRESYDPGYYAAFVRDLDGHRVEAVVHG